jgi:hypothetical protein
MNELIKLVAKNAGINEAQAKAAVDTVVAFIKQRLPAPLATQLDALLAAPISPEAIKGLEGLLGKK